MEALIRSLYASFNARDVEAVIAMLHTDVDWPNAWEGGRLHGHDAVRDYWRRQFAEIVGTVEPTNITSAGDKVEVTVHQTVRDHDGNLLSDGTVTHTYTFRDGRIARMDVS
jgi:ketosteroid isomerase-like protein